VCCCSSWPRFTLFFALLINCNRELQGFDFVLRVGDAHIPLGAFRVFSLDFCYRHCLYYCLYMNDTDYKAVLTDTLRKMVAVREETERLDMEAAKLRQFFFATLNMLPEDDRAQYIAVFREAGEGLNVREGSLKDAIVAILREGIPKYLTVADVRDRLNKSGFDFSHYTANPLASVSTTLKRMKPEEVESMNIEGVTAYRAKTDAPIRRRRNPFAPSVLTGGSGFWKEAVDQAVKEMAKKNKLNPEPWGIVPGALPSTEAKKK